MSLLFRKILPALLFLLLANSIFAQQNSVGYVRFVNAIGEKGKMVLRMNGEPVNTKGYAGGDYTGGVGLKTGKYEFTFEHPAAEEDLDLDVKIVDGVTTTYVAYLKPKKDKDGKLVAQEIAIEELEPMEPGGASVTAFSVCGERKLLPLELVTEGASKPVGIRLKPFTARKLSLNKGGDFAVAYKKKVVASMTMAEPGNFAVVLFESVNKEGEPTVRATMFLNEEFSGRN